MSLLFAQTESEKACPHAVCIPYPAQGHINPMLKLAKVLHHRGFHITFVNTEFNHRRLLKSRGKNSLDSVPSFRFETIPDGLPPPEDQAAADATQDIVTLSDSTRKNCLAPFRELISKLNRSSNGSSTVPPVSCIVSDGAMSFTVLAAQELGIPDVLLWTTSAAGFMGYVQYPQLIERGLTPFKDASYLTNGHLDTLIEWIPGMNGFRLKNLPTFLQTTDPNDIMMSFVLGEVGGAHKASAIIINTFDALEHDVVKALTTIFRGVYPIGPLQLLLKQIPENYLDSLGSSLWKEEPECLTWLDSKEPNSVVYVNFGSITVMPPKQLIEFAWGLANSEHSFLWIIRPDLVVGDSAILPLEFANLTKDRGLIANWCPQEEVLNHPSVGGFLTHCGWNSTLESICGGVPVICWPFFAEQPTNCWCCCNQWGIGMEVNSDVKRGEVESQVRELMVGEKGKETRRKALEWKKLAEEAAAGPLGSTYLNFEKMVQSVLLSK